MKKNLFLNEKGLCRALTLFSILLFMLCFPLKKAEAQSGLPDDGATVTMCINELSPYAIKTLGNQGETYIWWTEDPEWAKFGLIDSVGTDTINFISVYENLGPNNWTQKQTIDIKVRTEANPSDVQTFTLNRKAQAGWCTISGDNVVCPGETNVEYRLAKGFLSSSYEWPTTTYWGHSGGDDVMASGGSNTSEPNLFIFSAKANCVEGVYDAIAEVQGFPATYCPTMCSRAIKVEDKTPPVITMPDSVIEWNCYYGSDSVQKIIDYWMSNPEIAGLYWIDDCSQDVINYTVTLKEDINFPVEGAVLPNNFTLPIYWTATDECNNTAIDSTVIRISIKGSPKPREEVKQDSVAVVNCIDMANVITKPSFTVVDSCGNKVALDTVLMDTTRRMCYGNESIDSIKYTYIYTGLNGNTYEWRYTIVVRMDKAPTASTSTATTATVNCKPTDLAAYQATITRPTVSDQCGNTLSTPYSSSYTSTNHGCKDTVTYTFTYMDCYNNSLAWNFYLYVSPQDTMMFGADAVAGKYVVNVNDRVAHTDTLSASCLPTTPESPLTPNDYCDRPMTLIAETPVRTGVTCKGLAFYAFRYVDCKLDTFTVNRVYNLTPTSNWTANFSGTPKSYILSCLKDTANAAYKPAAILDTLKSLRKDDCGRDLTIVFDSVETMTTPTCPGASYHYTISDCAGNKASTTVPMYVKQEYFAKKPEYSKEVVCIEDLLKTPTIDTIKITSSCGDTLTGTKVGDPTFASETGYDTVAIYKFAYEDCTGNKDTLTYKLLLDIWEPTITLTSNGNVCRKDTVWPTYTIADDSCHKTTKIDSTVQFTGKNSNDDDCIGVYTFTYTFDISGDNRFTYTKVVTLNDTIKMKENTPLADIAIAMDPCKKDTLFATNSAYNYLSILDTLNKTKVVDSCGNEVFYQALGADSVIQPTTNTACTGTVTYKYFVGYCYGKTDTIDYTFTFTAKSFTSPTTRTIRDTVPCVASIKVDTVNKINPIIPTVAPCNSLQYRVINSNTIVENTNEKVDTVVLYHIEFSDCTGKKDTVQYYVYVIDTYVLPDDGGRTINCPSEIYTDPGSSITKPSGYPECYEITYLRTNPESLSCTGLITYEFKLTREGDSVGLWRFIDTLSLPKTFKDLASPVAKTISCIGDTVGKYTISAIRDSIRKDTVRDYCGRVVDPTYYRTVNNITGCIGTLTHYYKYTNCAGHSDSLAYVLTLNPPTFTLTKKNDYRTVACVDSLGASNALLLTYINTNDTICGTPVTVTLETGYPQGAPTTDADTVLVYKYIFTAACSNQTDTLTLYDTLKRNAVIEIAANNDVVECPKSTTDTLWNRAGFSFTHDGLCEEFTIDSTYTKIMDETCLSSEQYQFVITNVKTGYPFLYDGEKVTSVTVTYIDTVRRNNFELNPKTLILPQVTCPSYITSSMVTDSANKIIVVTDCNDTIRPVIVETFATPGTCATSATYRFAYAHPCYPNTDTLTVTIPIAESSYSASTRNRNDTVHCFSDIKPMTLPTGQVDNCNRAVTFGSVSTNRPARTDDQIAAGIDTIVQYSWTAGTTCKNNLSTLTQVIYLMKPLVAPADSTHVTDCVKNSTAPNEAYMQALIAKVDSCEELKYTLNDTVYGVGTDEKPIYDSDDCVNYVKYKYTLTDTNLGKSVNWSYVDTIKRVPFTLTLDTIVLTYHCKNNFVTSIENDINDTLNNLVVLDRCGDTIKNSIVNQDITATDANYHFSSDTCTGYVVYPVTYTDCSGNKDTLAIKAVMDYKKLELGSRSGTVTCVSDLTPDNAHDRIGTVTDSCGNILQEKSRYAGTLNSSSCNGSQTFYFIYEDCAGQIDTIPVYLTVTTPEITRNGDAVTNTPVILPPVYICNDTLPLLDKYAFIDTNKIGLSRCGLDTTFTAERTVSGDTTFHHYMLTQGCSDTLRLVQSAITLNNDIYTLEPTHFCGNMTIGRIDFKVKPEFASLNIKAEVTYPNDDVNVWSPAERSNLEDGTYYFEITIGECVLYDTVKVLNLEDVKLDLVTDATGVCDRRTAFPDVTVIIPVKQIGSPDTLILTYQVLDASNDTIITSGTFDFPVEDSDDTLYNWKLDMRTISSFGSGVDSIIVKLTEATIPNATDCKFVGFDNCIIFTIDCPDDISAAFELDCPEDTIVEIPWGACEYKFCSLADMPRPTFTAFTDDLDNARVNIFYSYFERGVQLNHADLHFGPGVHEIMLVGRMTVYDCEYFDTCYYNLIVNFGPCGDNSHYITGVDADGRPIFGNTGALTLAIDAEGNEYTTVLIDCDCWTAENLRSTQYADSTAIDTFYIYNTDVNIVDTLPNVEKWGLLYNWNTASRNQMLDEYNRMQGLCPAGWYLPTKENYESLVRHGAFALSAQNEWLGVNNTTDSTGFSALPSGYYNDLSRSFYYLLGDAYFWTANAHGLDMAWVAHIHFDCDDLMLEGFKKERGASIRCVKVDYDHCNIPPTITGDLGAINVGCDSADFKINITANNRIAQPALLRVTITPANIADSIQFMRAITNAEEAVSFTNGVAYINESGMASGLTSTVENYKIKLKPGVTTISTATITWAIVDSANRTEVWSAVKTTELKISPAIAPTMEVVFEEDLPFEFNCDTLHLKAFTNIGNCYDKGQFSIYVDDDFSYHYSLDSITWHVAAPNGNVEVSGENTIYIYIVHEEAGNLSGQDLEFYLNVLDEEGYPIPPAPRVTIVEDNVYDASKVTGLDMSLSSHPTDYVALDNTLELNAEPDTFYVHVDAGCVEGKGLIKINIDTNLARNTQIEYRNASGEWTEINFIGDSLAWFDGGVDGGFPIANIVVPVRAKREGCVAVMEKEISFGMVKFEDSTALTTPITQKITLPMVADNVTLSLTDHVGTDILDYVDYFPINYAPDTLYAIVNVNCPVTGNGLIKIKGDTAFTRYMALEYLQFDQTWTSIVFDGDSLAWFDGGVNGGFPIVNDTVTLRIRQVECTPSEGDYLDATHGFPFSFVMVAAAPDSATVVSNTVAQGLHGGQYYDNDGIDDCIRIQNELETICGFAEFEVEIEIGNTGNVSHNMKDKNIKGEMIISLASNQVTYKDSLALEFHNGATNEWDTLKFNANGVAIFDGGVTGGFPLDPQYPVSVSLRATTVNMQPVDLRYTLEVVDASNRDVVYARETETVSLAVGNAVISFRDDFPTVLSRSTNDTTFYVDYTASCVVDTTALIIITFDFPESIDLIYLDEYYPYCYGDYAQGVALFESGDEDTIYNSGSCHGIPLKSMDSIQFVASSRAMEKIEDATLKMWIIAASDGRVISNVAEKTIRLEENRDGAKITLLKADAPEEFTFPVDYVESINFRAVIDTLQYKPTVKGDVKINITSISENTDYDPSTDAFTLQYYNTITSKWDTVEFVDNKATFTGGLEDGFPFRPYEEDKLDTVLFKLTTTSIDKLTVRFTMDVVKHGTSEILSTIYRTGYEKTYEARLQIDVPCIDNGDLRTPPDGDGNIYRAALMEDGRIWMVENLRATKAVGALSSIDKIETGTPGTYTPYYVENENAHRGFGHYYNYAAAVGAPSDQSGADSAWCVDHVKGEVVQGLCPNGWHLPTVEEFAALVDAYHQKYDVVSPSYGKTDSSARYFFCPDGGWCGGDWDTWTTYFEHHAHRNISNFSALPAGYYDGGSPRQSGNCGSAHFLTTSVQRWPGFPSADFQYTRHYQISNSLPKFDGNDINLTHDKRDAYSIRCVQNDEPAPARATVDTIKYTRTEVPTEPLNKFIHKFVFATTGMSGKTVKIKITFDANQTCTVATKVNGTIYSPTPHMNSDMPSKPLAGIDYTIGTNGITLENEGLVLTLTTAMAEYLSGGWTIDVVDSTTGESLIKTGVTKTGLFATDSTNP